MNALSLKSFNKSRKNVLIVHLQLSEQFVFAFHFQLLLLQSITTGLFLQLYYMCYCRQNGYINPIYVVNFLLCFVSVVRET